MFLNGEKINTYTYKNCVFKSFVSYKNTSSSYGKSNSINRLKKKIKFGTLCPYTKLVWVWPHLVLCELWFQQNQIITQENDSYAVNFYSSGSWMNKFLYSVFCNKVYYEILSSSLFITVCNNFFFYLIVITQIWSNEVLPKKCFFENSLVSALSTIARLWEI